MKKPEKNKKQNPWVKLLKTLFYVVCLLILVCLTDVLLGRYLEMRILNQSSRDWRDGEQNFKNNDCYTFSEGLGFEPVWGNCNNSDLFMDRDQVESGNDFKIVVVGDSNTMLGKFDVGLEDELNAKYTDRKFEVIKAGVASYNTRQEVELLKTRLSDINPDLVVMQFTLNDFEITPVVVKIGDQIVYFSSNGEKRYRVNKFLFGYSKLYRFFQLNRLVVNSNTNPQEHEKVWSEKVRAMERDMRDFSDFVKSKNTNAVVLIYPVFADEQPEREVEAITTILKTYKINYIDMLYKTDEYGGPTFFQHEAVEGQPDTYHPNSKWDEVVTNTLVEYVGSLLTKK